MPLRPASVELVTELVLETPADELSSCPSVGPVVGLPASLTVGDADTLGAILATSVDCTLFCLIRSASPAADAELWHDSATAIHINPRPVRMSQETAASCQTSRL
jgi:hypothetical protein